MAAHMYSRSTKMRHPFTIFVAGCLLERLARAEHSNPSNRGRPNTVRYRRFDSSEIIQIHGVASDAKGRTEANGVALSLPIREKVMGSSGGARRTASPYGKRISICPPGRWQNLPIDATKTKRHLPGKQTSDSSDIEPRILFISCRGEPGSL